MKVHIGKYYRPARFERRDRDGTYSAFNPEMSSNASQLQGALLKPPVQPTHSAVLRALRNAIGSLV